MQKHMTKITTLAIAALLALSLAQRVTAAEEETKPTKSVKYSDDFSDPKKVENDSETTSNVKVFEGYGLSSANGQNGYAIWDLQKLFPAAAKDASFTLAYECVAVPPETRGVTWAVSDDGKEWKDISRNENGKPTDFKGRYLRASISWMQAAGPDYGSLKKFSVKTMVK